MLFSIGWKRTLQPTLTENLLLERYPKTFLLMIRFGLPTLRVTRGIKRKPRGGDEGRVRVLAPNGTNNRLLEFLRTLSPLRAPGVEKFASLRDGTYVVTSLVGIRPLQMICVRLLPLDRKGLVVLCPPSE